MNLSLPVRIILAAVSGIGVALIWVFGDGIWGTISFYLLAGLLFAAGVLFPYVSQSSFKLCRALGLVAASAASFWCAVTIASMTGYWVIISGSVVGVLIVMGALLLLAPIRISAMYVVLGFLAGISGGQIMGYTIDGGDILGFDILGYVGFAAWHVQVCLAIYFGTPTTRAGERFSAIWGRRIGAGQK